MEELILVRHGHSQHMVLHMAGGWVQTPLTQLGAAQAQAAAARLREELAGKTVRLFTSDLERTLQTARAIAEHIGVEPQLAPGLREQNLGVANTMTDEQAQQLGLNPVGPPVDRRWFPLSETWREMMTRVFACMDDLDRRVEGTVVAVSHAGCGTCVLFWWLGLAPDLWPQIQFELDLCSISVMRIGEYGGRRVMRLNDISHLAELAKPA